ncbi:hypothetical protein HWV62_41485 [Athelia sp. TMB]|nr:hypothetical protein HWV62_41485 [Athelia sp. TMB]
MVITTTSAVALSATRKVGLCSEHIHLPADVFAENNVVGAEKYLFCKCSLDIREASPARPNTKKYQHAHSVESYEKPLRVHPDATVEAARVCSGGKDSSGPLELEDSVLIVDWDGPDDPENPQKIISSTVTALITSIFVVGYAIGPLILSPLSEIYGRSHIIQLANLWYLAWNLGCSFAQSTSQLITFRLLASLGGSAALSIGGAVLGDCFAPEMRGQALAVYGLAPLLGPVLGPICGAWIAEKTSWRWAFWSTSLVDAAVARKANKIRKASKDSQTGQSRYNSIRTPFQTEDHRWKQIFTKGLIRPFALFVREPVVQLLGIYQAFSFGLLYVFVTTMPSIFQGVYRQKPGIAGLHYLALGLGIGAASQMNARTMDRVYRYLRLKHGGAGRPEYRLLGAASILITQSIQAYVIDTFTLYAASALAAVSALRSFAGFGFPLFAPAIDEQVSLEIGGNRDLAMEWAGVEMGELAQGASEKTHSPLSHSQESIMTDIREHPTSVVDWTRTDAYHNSFLIQHDAALEAARVHSAEQGLPAIAVSPAQGKFLKLVAQSIGAKRVIEIGVLGGYSTIWLGQAVGDDGVVVGFELKEKHAKVARENIARAGLEKTVKVVVGPAIDGLKALEAQPPFDLVYIDADSKSNLEYFIEAKRLLRKGGIIFLDNAVINGFVSKLDFEDEETVGVRRLLHALQEDKELDATTISTVGERGYDGFFRWQGKQSVKQFEVFQIAHAHKMIWRELGEKVGMTIVQARARSGRYGRLYNYGPMSTKFKFKLHLIQTLTTTIIITYKYADAYRSRYPFLLRSRLPRLLLLRQTTSLNKSTTIMSDSSAFADAWDIPVDIKDWDRTDEYHNSFLVHPDAHLEAARANTAEQGIPDIAVSAAQGKLLKLIAQSIGAKRIIEVGVLGGYSTMWMGQAVGSDGEIIGFEINEKHAAVSPSQNMYPVSLPNGLVQVARDNFAKAGLDKVIKVVVGPAIDGLKELKADPPFDLVFIDADKQSNLEYFTEAKRLVRNGGIIVSKLSFLKPDEVLMLMLMLPKIVDNVCQNGLVSKPDYEDPAVKGIRRLLRALKDDKEVDATTISTVGSKGYDGFMYARKL